MISKVSFKLGFNELYETMEICSLDDRDYYCCKYLILDEKNQFKYVRSGHDLVIIMIVITLFDYT